MQAPAQASAWNALEPYAQLVTSLLPRAAGICVFDHGGDLRWTNDDTSHTDLEPVVRDAMTRATDPESAGEVITLSGGIPAYFFWLRNDVGALHSVVAVAWRVPEAPRAFATVHALVRPALEALRRELLSRHNIENLTSALDARDRDVELLLAASDRPKESGPDGADELSFVLQSSASHLRCRFAALLVPEKNLVVLRAAQGQRVDGGALARLHRHLLSLSQLQAEPMIVNDVATLTGAPDLAYRLLVCPLRHPSGRPGGLLALFRPSSELSFSDREARLGALLGRRCTSIVEASYDSLSGLLNRGAFEQRARSLLLDTRGDRNWAGLYVDIDRMHALNDNFGMHIGDRLLARVGELIRTSLVPGAIAGRVSGDRFAVLLPASEQDALAFAQTLREYVAGITALSVGAADARSFAATVSIGVAALVNAKLEFAHAFAVAETACKAAKDRGRNRVELYQASDASIVRRHEDMNIAPSLRLAISEGRLRLVSQLILPLEGSRSSRPHFEILLRMLDDDGETVGPDRFLSAAIRYQLMPMVDRWVVEEAVRQLKPHRDLLEDKPVIFTINLSGQSLGDASFGDFVVETIQQSGLNPAVFCFEITESAAISNLSKAEGFMLKLRRLGCGIALDDFGTGLSSLSYLRTLPIDMLKIDGSFVRDVLKDPRAGFMVEAIAKLASSMGLTTVAEYVETDEIRLRVSALGVDYGQGFAIARPAPLADLLVELPIYATARSIAAEVLEAPPSTEGIEVHIEPDEPPYLAAAQG